MRPNTNLLAKELKIFMTLTYESALKLAERKLNEVGIGTSHLDALVLLEDITKANRAKLLSNPKDTLSKTEAIRFKRQVNARAKHLPLAYVRGKTEFYGREFSINKHVLEPRPESEAIIEELKDITKDSPKTLQVMDIGTGSGALIISAKLECPSISAIAIDIDKNCLNLARKNAAKYKQNILFIKSDLIQAIPATKWSNKPVIILANLPYVPDDWQLNLSATKEPRLAIFGGKDGLELYTRLFKQLSGLSHPPRWVITEALPPKHKDLKEIAANSGYELKTTNDFVQVFYLFRKA